MNMKTVRWLAEGKVRVISPEDMEMIQYKLGSHLHQE